MELLYTDNRIVVCLKPAGVLSTDEPGGMPELLRRALGEDETGCVRVVHRLDRPVGGVMVYARSRMADSILSRQVQAHTFEKDYLAVLEGDPGRAGGRSGRSSHARRSEKANLRHAHPRPGRTACPAFVPGAWREGRARACAYPAGNRQDASDPRAVFLPRPAALRRPEIRRTVRRPARPLVVSNRVFPPADE